MSPMPVPADKFSAIIERLADPMRPPSELELRRIYKELRDLHENRVPSELLAQYYHALGNVSGEMKKYDEALKWHRLAAQTEPRDPSHLCNVATALSFLNREGEALETYVKASELPAGYNSFILGNIAGHLASMGRRIEAVEVFREAVALATHDSVNEAVEMAQRASAMGLEHEALRFLVRAFELHTGVSAEGRDPVAYLRRLPVDCREVFAHSPVLLEVIEKAYALRDALPVELQKPLLFRATTQEQDEEAAQESLRVFEETRNSRRRANTAVIGEQESAQPSEN